MRQPEIIDAEFEVVGAVPVLPKAPLFAPWWRYFTLTRDEWLSFRPIKLAIRYYVWGTVLMFLGLWPAAYVYCLVYHLLK